MAVFRQSLLALAAGLGCAWAADPAPRNVVIDGQQWKLAATGEPIVMSGPNVVVKGPPYFPSVDGDAKCVDVVDDVCMAAGNCTTCYTFNSFDVENIRAQGWNSIRLGVVWAGGMPQNQTFLDPDFEQRLHAVLDLTDAEGIHVVLDNHGDMVGTAGCGNGVPMWVQQQAAPDLIGLPLETGLPYSLDKDLNVKNLDGYDHCGDDASKWAEYAGDPNYNLLNECCQAMNSGNPGALGYTTISQATMDYVMMPGAGRDAFVQFWTLVAQAVAQHPSAIALELMNEPMSLRRRDMYDTWRAVTESVEKIVPDLAVSVTDVGEAALLPPWLDALAPQGAGLLIDPDTVAWIKNATNVFYSWHWYGLPKSAEDGVRNVRALQADWNVPSYLTEFGDCSAWNAAAAANISHSYWHYSCYCDTGPWFGNKSVPDETFGGCLLGWASGKTEYNCDDDA